ncbi:hypothetical protein GOTRE_150_00720 [Gordonia terrae NBRC 100016]|nr:hypothetical protein GOTRE_150_00720 [Gordonia terrae NBRC 100016]
MCVALLNGAAHLMVMGHMGFAHSIVWLAMAAGCVVCGVHLVRDPTTRLWALTALMSVAMLALHMAAAVGGVAHQHGVTMAADRVAIPASMHVSLLVTLAELVLALGALWWSTSHLGTVAPAVAGCVAESSRCVEQLSTGGRGRAENRSKLSWSTQ